MAEPLSPDIDARRLKAVVTLAATVAFAASPLVADGFAGFAPDLFPVPQERPPVQPAGWAFAIWGLIYAALLVHAGVGLTRRADAADWDAPRWPLIASLVPGAVWIPTAGLSAGLATALLVVMLAGALAALARAPRRDGWTAGAPLRLYAGWLTAATGVAAGLMLAGHGLTGEMTAALLALAAVAALAARVIARGAPPAYAAAVGWALAGVIAANLGRGGALPVVAAAAAALALLAVVALRAARRPAAG